MPEEEQEPGTASRGKARAVQGGGAVTQTLRLDVYPPEGERTGSRKRDRESRTDVRGSHSFRTIWKNGKALQIAFDNTNEFSHVDCKACAQNPWWARDGAELSTQYDVKPTGPNLWKITCKKCGWVFDSG
jgi:predicted nucleic-acid-binding Zn-ribbon protein